jgi:hypothetical protein
MQALVLLPEWQCHTCTAAQQLQRGCITDATKPIELDGEKQVRCPRRMMLDEPQFISEVWWLYSKYTDGILPEHGGLYDQPARFIAVVRLLDNVKASATSEQEDRDKRRRAIQANASRVFNAG